MSTSNEHASLSHTGGEESSTFSAPQCFYGPPIEDELDPILQMGDILKSFGEPVNFGPPVFDPVYNEFTQAEGILFFLLEYIVLLIEQLRCRDISRRVRFSIVFCLDYG
jgi:hypothetical protein